MNVDFFHATDVLTRDTTMKELKLSRLFILRFFLQNEDGGNMQAFVICEAAIVVASGSQHKFKSRNHP